MLNVGDRVRIKSEWCNDEQERNYEYTIVNVNEVTERYILSIMLPGFVIPVTELVNFDMIEKL